MVIFSPKDPLETDIFTFDFTQVLGVSETIASTTVVIDVRSGYDPSPNSMLVGFPVINGSQVGQMLTGGRIRG